MDTVLKIVKDMEVLDKFLKPKGRFVGDMVHISIADLAACIRAASQPEVVTVEYFTEELGVLFTDKNYRTEVAKYLSFYYPNGIRIVQDKEGG